MSGFIVGPANSSFLFFLPCRKDFRENEKITNNSPELSIKSFKCIYIEGVLRRIWFPLKTSCVFVALSRQDQTTVSAKANFRNLR